MVADLKVKIAGIELANPVMTASGTFGYGEEFGALTEVAAIGAVVVKGISWAPRPGNPPPRIVETPCGMLNAIGLENVGVERFIEEKLPWLRAHGCRVVVNILGGSVDEYCRLAARLSEVEGIDALEVNISCPNVKHGGVAFGTNEEMARELTREVKAAARVPIIIKLSPNVTDIAAMALAVEEGGADAVSLINTLIGMAIDIQRQRPVLANVIGGLSGPAIKPVGVRMVWEVAGRVKIPVIGIGGISCWQDAVEYSLAGASAVQVGTANFVDPRTTDKIINGLERYLADQGAATVTEIIGRARS